MIGSLFTPTEPIDITSIIEGFTPSTPRCRVGAWDKDKRVFEVVQGRKGALNLTTLSDKINELVDIELIDRKNVKKINAAIENRVCHLLGRKTSFWVRIFAGRKIDKIIGQLRGIQNRISETAEKHQVKPTNTAVEHISSEAQTEAEAPKTETLVEKEAPTAAGTRLVFASPKLDGDFGKLTPLAVKYVREAEAEGESQQ